uniref:Ig-like domain-containing protein n=1 Tax=Bubo bubo TaxID=30461 RepID=A0A8C0EHP7_BUBBB
FYGLISLEKAGNDPCLKAKTAGVVEQSPLYVNPQQGQSISITCALKSSREDEGIYLLKTHMQPERVLHVSSQNDSTIFPAFANRLEYSKQEKKIVITLHNLQKNDSDIYVCAVVVKNSSFLSVNRSGTMMLIKGTTLSLALGVAKDLSAVCQKDLSHSAPPVVTGEWGKIISAHQRSGVLTSYYVIQIWIN